MQDEAGGGHDPLAILQRQIDNVYIRFQAICAESASLVADPRMPEAAQQLHGVLAETEQAASAILSAGRAINELVGAAHVPAQVRDRVQAEVTRIYEAATFQDLSGQRIKQVLRSLRELETQLANLARAARGEPLQPAFATPGDPLLNGPAPVGNAPSQADVDSLFN